ncbi:Beta-2-glycoprotein 1, partial [Ophiophagus hannah]
MGLWLVYRWMVVCPRPPEVPLATIDVNKEAYIPGEAIVYQCNPGYIPQSSSRRYICPAFGIWPTVIFKCIRGLGFAPPLFAQVTSGTYVKQEEKALKMGQQAASARKKGAGVQACPNVIVTVICPPPPVSEFGVLAYHKIESGETFVFQETIRFSCLLPFAMFGSETATCQADGSWTPLPECKSVECPRPEPIEHGFINFALRATFRYQDTVNYGCNPPYTLDEASESRCEKTGTWSNKPTCKAPCNIPVNKATVLYNGRKIKAKKLKSIQHAETIWFFCKSNTEDCSYKTPTQCIHGQLSVPDCYE